MPAPTHRHTVRPLYRQPRWMLGHFIILFVVVVMIALGFWQLSRLHQTEHHNAAVRTRMSGVSVFLNSSNVASLPQYQKVSVAGSWDAPDTYLVRYPIHLGQEGYWEIEPVILDNGGRVLVNRGWITLDAGRAMTKPTDADGGSVQIEGLMQKAQTAHDPNGTDGANPPVITQTAITGRWVQLTGPVNPGDPVPLDPPDLSNGSHFSYTLQWWSFALIAVIGWITVLRCAARDQRDTDVIDLTDTEAHSTSKI